MKSRVYYSATQPPYIVRQFTLIQHPILMRTKIKSFFVLALVSVFISISSLAQKDSTIKYVKEYIKRIVDNEKSASIIIGVINKDGKQIISYGELEKGSGKKPDENSLYGIGSITKLFTCSLLADMVKSGKMKLNDPISKYLPDSVNTPTYNGKEIRLYDLATHTSGLPPRPDNLYPLNPNNPYGDYTISEAYSFLSHYKLSREIGIRYEYSNIGVGLLGYIIAKESNSDFETTVHRKICKPLRLKHTVITVSEKLKKNMAIPYDNEGNLVIEWTFSPVFAGAGSFKSTTNDMLEFVAANLGLISSKLTQTLIQTHLKHPQNNISLGWHIWNDFGSINYGHSGSTIGYKSFVGFNNESRTGVVVLSNKTDAIIDIGLHLLDNRYKLQDTYFKNEFTDLRDNHIYKTVKIGDQTWMAENLAYIPFVSTPDSQGGIWVYNYFGNEVKEARKTAEYQKYGCLYNLETSRKVCPNGWHLPSDNEWKQLEITLGMNKIDADTIIWRGTKQGMLLREGSLVGFSTLFGGWRTGMGKFNYLDIHANFWTSTEYDNNRSYERLLNINVNKIGRNVGNKDCGFSVRCVKDKTGANTNNAMSS